ncbi:MAG: phosphatidylethanolamine N-methyltransferase family protein [Candidatus Hydrogenedentes bacterium]|nr:phosphatidylethanolamine N-methyltransferase family protein [Candidatus Hydrogenedentota bacterium]
MLLLKSAVFALIVPGTVAGLVPYWILRATGHAHWPETGVRAFFGLGIFLLGAVTASSSVWRFAVDGKGTPAPIDPPKFLVSCGTYRITRNPMYVGVVSMVLGEAAVFTSAWLLVYGLFLFCLFHAFVVLYEEPTLRRQFGPSYEDFCRSVPRWFWPGTRK